MVGELVQGRNITKQTETPLKFILSKVLHKFLLIFLLESEAMLTETPLLYVKFPSVKFSQILSCTSSVVLFKRKQPQAS